MTGSFRDEVNRTTLKTPEELSKSEVLGIVDMFAHGNPMVTVAQVYMVEVETVKEIVNGRLLANITGLPRLRSSNEEVKGNTTV